MKTEGDDAPPAGEPIQPVGPRSGRAKHLAADKTRRRRQLRRRRAVAVILLLAVIALPVVACARPLADLRAPATGKDRRTRTGHAASGLPALARFARAVPDDVPRDAAQPAVPDDG